jgi:anti-anti-sigma factor
MSIAVAHHRPDALRVTIRGDVDVQTAESLRAELLALLADERVVRVFELDLSEVDFCDLAGLRAVAAACDAATQGGRQMFVCAAGACTSLILATLDAGDAVGYQPVEAGRGAAG